MTHNNILDMSNPIKVARFCVGLGYDRDRVVNAVAQRGNLDTSTAQRITDEAIAANRQATTEGGQHGAD